LPTLSRSTPSIGRSLRSREWVTLNTARAASPSASGQSYSPSQPISTFVPPVATSALSSANGIAKR
jgi:hypothetical protein